MQMLKTVLLLGCAAAVAVTLGGCREEEQDRILIFQKGVYSGAPDTPVSQQARRAQRVRMRQGNLSGGDRGGGGAAPPDVRPPAGAMAAPPSIPLELLRRRGEGQRFN